MNRRHACVGAGAGLALALVGIGHRHPSLLDLVPRARPVRWWVTDRAGCRLIGLDPKLFVRCEVAVRAPLAVVRGRAGPWVVSARGGARDGPHELLQLDEQCKPAERHALGPVRALATRAGGGVWLLEERAGETRVLECAPGGAPRERARVTGGSYLARARGRLLVAATWGELWCLRGERLVATRVLEAELVDLAPAPAGWWALGREHVYLLDEALGIVSVRRFAFVGGCLARAPDGGAWVLARDGPQLARFGRGGSLRFTRSRLPVQGFTTAHADREDGLLAATPCALLALDASGRVVRGQGGFDYVGGLAPAS